VQLIHGDCLEKMKDIPDKSIDMILCDLPYGTTACKWDIIIPFEPLWEQYKRIIKDNGAIVLFGSEPFSSYLRMSNIKQYKYDWKWDKVVGSNFVQAKKQPLRIYEDICVFYKKQPTYNPQMEERKKENERPSNKPALNNINGMTSIKCPTIGKMKYPVNKIEINRMSKELNSSRIIHPTQKPVALLEYLIKTYTLEGETVLDNTMGSGSTGVACINTKRNFIGIEKDDKYFEVAKKRIEERTNIGYRELEDIKSQLTLF
jgi:DNA modification methylase